MQKGHAGCGQDAWGRLEEIRVIKFFHVNGVIMKNYFSSNALFTDFYELTMAQGYWKENMNQKVVFDMFFRRNP